VNSLTPAAATTGQTTARSPRRRPRPRASWARLAAVALPVGLLATACGSSSPPKAKALNVAGVQRAIELSIHKEHGITTAVHCPAKVPVREGFRFTCKADLAVGVYPLNVVEVTKKGGVRYSSSVPLQVLDSHTVERAIQKAILKERHLHSTVSCPAPILQEKGLKFTCTATTKKGSGPFTVTEVNSIGGVTFVGH